MIAVLLVLVLVLVLRPSALQRAKAALSEFSQRSAELIAAPPDQKMQVFAKIWDDLAGKHGFRTKRERGALACGLALHAAEQGWINEEPQGIIAACSVAGGAEAMYDKVAAAMGGEN